MPLTDWRRWIASLLHGPLAELSALGGGDSLDELDELHDGATRAIAARVLISLARERLIDARRQPDALELVIGGEPIRLPLARAGAFELDRPDLARRGDARLEHALADPFALLDRLEGVTLDLAARRRLRAELASSVDNLASARWARAIRHRLAAARAHDVDPRLTEPEHFVTEGHPWHPMTRTRLGIGRADSLRHAPELLARCPIALVELDAALARVSGDWHERSARFGVEPRPGWVIVPVHPVQRRRLARLLPQLWGRALRPIEHPPIAARPLLSLRTAELPGGDHHVKLSLGIHTTSARRTVSPMSVADGPTISALLEAIRARDPIVRELAIMSEPAAVGLEPSALPEARRSEARELGAILRVVPAGLGEPWVCAALAERWPGSEATLLERACAGFAGGGVERIAAGLEVWFERLVPALLRLFVGYGIALEAHLQNTLVVVDAGRPIGFRVRDLGGIRLHRERLRRAGYAPGFDAESFVITDDLDEARGKLVHALVHAQLAHLFELADDLGLPESRSWARLATTIDALLHRWASDPAEPEHLREAASLERERLFEPRVRAKALLRMRLSERFSDYEYTWVDNAIVRPSGPP